MPHEPSAQPLDLDGFRAALTSLGNALEVAASPEFARLDSRWQDTVVAGVVQHFEFTFELSWKMLKRQLERELPSPTVLDGMSFRELIRVGFERGLVEAPEPWFGYRELRNITSHAYAKDKALKVAAGAHGLLTHATRLLNVIDQRNHA